MKISEQVVQDRLATEYDKTILHTPSFDVNMRLFRSSDGYRHVIMKVIEYLEKHLNSIFEDHPNPSGVSCPKLGIPFNIIAYKDSANKNRFMINPKIVFKSNLTTTGRSQCGCFDKTTWFPTLRYDNIDVEFFDLSGQKVIQRGINKDQRGFVIQHEIQHCQGIMPSETPVRTTETPPAHHPGIHC